eukprot:jgi/Chlat1/1300/Chrsp118S01738
MLLWCVSVQLAAIAAVLYLISFGTSSNIARFKRARVIPDIIDDNELGGGESGFMTARLRVGYEGAAHAVTDRNSGIELELEWTQKAPVVTLDINDEGEDADAYPVDDNDNYCHYCLMMVDADADTKPTKEGNGDTLETSKQWLHWLVANIPDRDRNVTKGREFVKYYGCAPREGRHRYVFLLYRQQAVVQSVDIPASRGGDDVRAFASKHDLGQAIGGTFFYASA